jgi:hypothetical protein
LAGGAASDLDFNSLPIAPDELYQAGISFMHPMSAKQAAELADALDACTQGCARPSAHGRGWWSSQRPAEWEAGP